MKVVLLYGGGIDSTALLHMLSSDPMNDVHAVFFDYGQKASQLEQQACEYFCAEYNVPLKVMEVRLAELSNSALFDENRVANDVTVNIVDGRNLAFIALTGMVVSKLKADALALGFHVEPTERPFPDATQEFIEAVNAVVKYGYQHQFKVITPMAHMTRQDIFKYAQQNDPHILKYAHTCYENVLGGCGACTHCTFKEATLAELACAE